MGEHETERQRDPRIVRILFSIAGALFVATAVVTFVTGGDVALGVVWVAVGVVFFAVAAMFRQR